MIPLRSPDEVMRLSRLGASHQTRLSFMRTLLRGLRRGRWKIDRPLWQIDANGVGRAVYRARGDGQCYSLVAFGHDLPDHLRSDRVIAEAWDATFALVDGEVTNADLDRLAANVPLQEAGRVSDRELVLSRANRSVRLWDHVVARLSNGRQPDAERVDNIGYLMRTTAVYGSGKFGAADHAALRGRPLFDGPFRAEMLAVWLIRSFAADLVEHLAERHGGKKAARLSRDLRRRLGVGNSTGLGMAPFLVNHPGLLNAWIMARETALARVRSLPISDETSRTGFAKALGCMHVHLSSWHTTHPIQLSKLADLQADIERISRRLEAGILQGPTPWNALWHWAKSALTTEGQEMLVSIMIEPHGTLVDDLVDTMGADEMASFKIDGLIPLTELKSLLEKRYAWTRTIDFAAQEACARFWYVSEAKLEPRLGERHLEPGAALEQPLDIARSVSALALDLSAVPNTATIAAFLERHPKHRRIIRRIQMSRHAPYGEIRDNLIAADLLPIDMLRCKLAFFGATRFDPRSDRWLRITMYQNAPYPDELHAMPDDDWILSQSQKTNECLL